MSVLGTPARLGVESRDWRELLVTALGPLVPEERRFPENLPVRERLGERYLRLAHYDPVLQAHCRLTDSR
jgi:hypothetical protein